MSGTRFTNALNARLNLLERQGIAITPEIQKELRELSASQLVRGNNEIRKKLKIDYQYNYNRGRYARD